MKYLFIINPVAGQGKGIEQLKNRIHDAFRDLGIAEDNYEIHVSAAHEDAIRRAREFGESLNGEKGRVYACGGDGTVSEVVNGLFGFENVAFGVIPIGTGNDLIRNFSASDNFKDIKEQIQASTQKIDLIRYRGMVDGEDTTGYCVNMINIGFDCNVVELAGRLKQKPLIAGSFAYLLAVFGMFIKKKGIALKITELGKDKLTGVNVLKDDEMLLCAVCNGSYCGGGIKSSPMSRLDDGKFELNIINDVSRMKFMRLFPKFQKGEHLEIPGIEKIVEIRSCKDAVLESNRNWDFFICVDGEIKKTTGIRVTLLENAMDMVIPGI